MQWAAVTTYLEATKVPPQNCPPRLSTTATIQGYLLAGATSVPPTILELLSTPHLQPVTGEILGEKWFKSKERVGVEVLVLHVKSCWKSNW